MQFLNTISNSRFLTKHRVMLAWGAAALLLSLVLARTGWIVYTQNKIKTSNYQPQEVAPLARPAKKSYRIKDVVEANLFGDPKPAVVAKKAPKTTLNLKLQGILSASEPGLARAIIQGGNKGKAELYSVGESIKGAGASIKEIRHNEVLLNRNGAIESLPLVKSKSSGKGEIITFSDADSTAYQPTGTSGVASAVPIKSASDKFNRASQNNALRQRAANGAPRKVRKPNFSGLDRALKKKGEI